MGGDTQNIGYIIPSATALGFLHAIESNGVYASWRAARVVHVLHMPAVCMLPALCLYVACVVPACCMDVAERDGIQASTTSPSSMHSSKTSPSDDSSRLASFPLWLAMYADPLGLGTNPRMFLFH